VSRRIFLLIGLFFIAYFEFKQFFIASPGRSTEITKEATATAKITAGELATVANIIDGDTIELTDGRRVRYIGIDAPEYNECYGQEAKEENRKFVENKSIRLEKDSSNTDNYGRLLRYVYVGDTMVNEFLVIGGFARAWSVPPDEKLSDAFSAAQLEARQMSRGLWQACRK